MENKVERIYGLTPMQEGMLFHYLASEQSTEYFNQKVIQLKGTLNVEYVKECLHLLAKKHAVLRTAIFHRKIKQPRQVVLTEREITTNFIDLSHLSIEKQEKRETEIIDNDRQNGFDLEKDSLLRFTIIKFSSQMHKLIWSFHHIIVDGWSMALIVKEFMEYYNHLQKGVSCEKLSGIIERHGLSIDRYEDYVKWLTTLSKEQAINYWENLLKDYHQEAMIQPYNEKEATKGEGIVSLQLEQSVYEKMKEISNKYNVTMNTTMEAAWGLLLQSYNAIDDVVYGKVVSGRNASLKGMEEMVGLFINTIPVRVQMNKDTRIFELLQALQLQSIESGMHDFIPLADIQAKSNLKGRLIHSIIAFENYNSDYTIDDLTGLSLEIEVQREKNNYPITLVAYPDKELKLEIIYDETKYSTIQMKYMLEHLKTILTAIVTSPVQQIRKINRLSEEEGNLVVNSFNQTKTSYPSNASLYTLFEQQVKNAPHAIALMDAEGSMTYEELNNRANELLGELQRRGSHSSQLIGILTEKSRDFIAGIIAISKNGCGYVPIDTALPEARIRHIVEECNIEQLIGRKVAMDRLQSVMDDKEVIYLDESYRESTEAREGSSTDIAYVLFTSGSTGKPKGVMVEHRSVVRLVKNTNYLPFEHIRILQTGSLSFDASTLEIWGALLNGGVLCLVETEELLDPEKLKSAIQKYEINTMFMTTQFFNNTADLNPSVFKGIKHLLIGGERISEKHVRKVFDHITDISVINGYGPTENTTFSLTYKVDDTYERTPIGKPIANSTAYIIKDDQLCGIGMPGELWVGGDGVARGYINHPELTEERFVSSSFIREHRLYRTGDLARWLPDGNIDYLGRIDEQVKIRGFRIELYEIEEAFKKLPSIKDVAVLIRNDSLGEKVICAYVVTAEESQLNVLEVKQQLRAELPYYMIPVSIQQIDRFPVTKNGKLDKDRLPSLEGIQQTEDFIAPRTELEKKIAMIFSSILGEQRVGLKDDFFEMGGHSLRAVRVVNQLEAMTGVRIQLNDLFIYPTVEELSSFIQKKKEKEYLPIPTARKKEYYSMSSAQRRLFVVQKMDDVGTSYNMPIALEINRMIDFNRLKKVVKALIKRHEIFRTHFQIEEGQAVQKIMDDVEPLIEYEKRTEWSNTDKHHLFAAFIRPFDLKTAPLFRVKLIHIGAKDSFLFFDMHHIISDGMSVHLLVQEFSQLYDGEKLPHQEVQYKDYSEWMESRDLSKQKEYWLSQFKELPSSMDLPLDEQRPKIQSFKGATLQEQLDRKVVQQIQAFCRKTGTTEYMFLLSALFVLLQKYSKQSDIVIGSPVSNRTHPDTEKIQGMFVNTLPLRGKPAEEKRYMDFLKEIKEGTITALENQEYPFEELMESIGITRDLARNPLFDVMFVMQNNEKADFLLDGEKLIEMNRENSTAKFDLTVHIVYEENSILVHFEYARELFKQETIQWMIRHYQTIIHELLKNPLQKLLDVKVVDAFEKAKILEFSNDEKRMDTHKTVIQLFEEQVEKTPNHIAVEGLNQQMTYKQLNNKANQLAKKIRELGVRPEDFVALLCERREEMVIGLLAILKAGGAYIPIDPNDPKERMDFMIEDSKPKAILTSRKREFSSTYNVPILDLNETINDTENIANLPIVNQTNHLMYVMYTSGTTGKPKGVMVEHKSVVRLVKAPNYIELNEQTVILQTGAISFDASTFEIWGALLNGGKLCLVAQEQLLDAIALEKAIKELQVNTMWITASLFNQLIAQRKTMFHPLSYLLIGGEKLSDHHVRLFKLHNKKTKLINGYGPTENTTFTLTYEIPDEFQRIPIGKAITNTQVYVLNHGELCGIGIPGELCIVGAGLARGYLNQIELTKKQFIDHPFEDGSLYKSGDIVRWLPDGNIEYIGRIDDQVKIRGYRIEPSEIENKIRKRTSIQDIAVVPVTDVNSEKKLAAYLVSEEAITYEQFREMLKQELPDYMIPALMMMVDQLPLTKNGKLDRKKLPEIQLSSSKQYVEPSNRMEELVASIFAEILGIEKVGVYDDFFELGGHSLRAIRIINRLEAEAGVSLTLKDFFENSTVRGLSKTIQRKEKKAYVPIPYAEKKKYYSMSSAQKRLFLIQEMTNTETIYNMPICLKTEGLLKMERLNEVMKQLTQRHETLRTRFLMIEEEPVQQIVDAVDIPIEYEEMQLHHTSEIRRLMKEFVRPFHLSNPPLMRVKVVQVGKEQSYLFIDMHHIISDGMSMNLLIEEFSTLYDGKVLQEPGVQYKDYSEWQSKQDLLKQKEYWVSEWKEIPPVLDLPLDYPRAKKRSYRGDKRKKWLSKRVVHQLKEFSRKTETTEYMVLLAALMIMLARYSRQEDIVVGSPVLGRTHQDTEKMLGMFVHTLALRAEPKGNKSVKAFLMELKDKTIQALENQEYPFEELIENLPINRDPSRNPLFDIMFALQNNDRKILTADGSSFKEVHWENNISKFDLTVHVTEEENGYIVTFEYASDLFRKETIEQMLHHYENSLQSIIEDKEQLIEEVPLLSKKEKELVVHSFNKTKHPYPCDRTIVELFEEQVKKSPNAVAVIYKDVELTYLELNERANQLGHHLRRLGVERDDLVAIFAEKNLEVIIGMIGILKAGGAYVPMDPSYPKERIEYLLTDCKPKVVLTTHELPTSSVISPILSLHDPRLHGERKENLPIVNKQDDLLYIMYTSGTTGKPKGVMIEHRNAVRLVKNTKYVKLNHDTKILQTGSLSFDASTFEIWGALLNGGLLCLADKDVILDDQKLKETIHKNKITHMFTTTQLFNSLIDSDPSVFSNLAYLLIGGEKLSEEHASKVLNLNQNKGLSFIHCYGPTENTTFSLTYEMDKKYPRMPIGYPIENSTAYIFNGKQLCGLGIPGEICVGGDGVARGYLNRSALTRERFVDNPVIPGEKMYRTGDLGRWLPDGSIDFLGRIDDQVKLRGYRIELEEIESVIRKQHAIQNAAVVLSEENLCAYLVFEQGSYLSTEDLKYLLRKELPDFMIPSYYQALDKLPINKNGKLDKKLLPKIEQVLSKEYVAPRNETEEKIAQCFKHILGVEKVGVKDHFFEIGGHSLRAVRLLNVIEATTGVRLSIHTLFTAPTVEELSNHIRRSSVESYASIPKAEEKDVYSMSSMQKRLFVIQEMDKNSVAYNMPIALEVVGLLDREKMHHALKQLINRHEILRTSFGIENGEAIQRVKKDVELVMEYREQEEQPEHWKKSLLEDFVRPFDLTNGPLLRVRVLKIGRNRSLLLFDMHHIISDGMSMNNLIKEFSAIYDGKELEDLSIQYKDYCEWLKTRDITDQKEYWLKEFSELPEPLNLPLDYTRPPTPTYQGSRIKEFLSKELTGQIKDWSTLTGTTEYMVLLSAFMVLLSKYSLEEDMVIGTPVSGRVHQDTESLLGMFVQTLALRGEPKGDKYFIDFLREIKSKTIQALENQEYPLEALIEAVATNRPISRNPLFDVMFVFQNNEMIHLQADGMSFKKMDWEIPISKFDLSVNIHEENGCFVVTFEYASDLFKSASIQQMIMHYQKILQEVIHRPNQRIKEIDCVTEKEKMLIKGAFNDTNYPFEWKTVGEIFEEQVEKSADNIAIWERNREVTYKELNKQANQLARVLRKYGVGANSVVAIVQEKSIEAIIAIIATIKAGGAFVSVDPTYPSERIEYILADSNPKVILSGKDNLPISTGTPVLSLKQAEWEKESVENLPCLITPNDLMYIIYTSGTTGRPKGVMLEHRGVVNLQAYFIHEYSINETDHILQFANHVFDASVFEITMALLNGASLYLVTEDVIHDPQKFSAYISNHQISVVTLTPQYFAQVDITGPRLIITAGSESNKQVAEKANRIATYMNAYGPSENTVCTSHWLFEQANIQGRIPIGKPIMNTQCFIINNGKLCGIGMPGELCIAGMGVARGYLNLPKLTTDKFIDHPMLPGKLYRTGDLARWLSDGNIEYLGRIDEQVKIRGYRMELSEIESVIREVGAVKDVAVVTKENEQGDTNLLAYIVSDMALDLVIVQEHMKEKLPAYMIPAYLMVVDHIPVTRSGKVDKKNLPEMKMEKSGAYQPPRNEIEEMVADILTEVLAIPEIGMNDNFLEIGGDSIKGIRAVSKLREVGYEVSIQDFIQAKTVEELCKKIKKTSALETFEQGEVIGEFPLTPIQQTFMDWNLPNPNYFNQSIMIKMKDRMKLDVLQVTLTALVQHHDMLRAIYENGFQRILSSQESQLFDIELVDLTHKDSMEDVHLIIEKKANQLQNSFQLSTGPLMRVGIFRMMNDDHLLFCFHHFVVDGVSLRILLEDFQLGYAQYLEKKEIHLPYKTSSYKQWSQFLITYKESNQLKQEEQYWKTILEDIPASRNRFARQEDKHEVLTMSLELNEENTLNLLQRAHMSYGTDMNDLLLSAFGLAIKHCFGEEKVAVDLEGHGRDGLDLSIQVDRTVGWFTSLYPVVLSTDDDIRTMIIGTKEMLRKIPNKGIGFGLLKEKWKNNDYLNKVNISFNYLGEIDYEINRQDAISISEFSKGLDIAKENGSIYSLSINGFIVEQKLCIHIMYDHAVYTEQEIKLFIQWYDEKLRKVIAHCINQEQKINTASDYHHDLSIEALEEIEDLFS